MGKLKWEYVFSFLVESFGGMKTFFFRRELLFFCLARVGARNLGMDVH